MAAADSKPKHARTAGLAALAALLALPAGKAAAGGPLYVRSNGQPYAWSTAAPIVYRTDNGPLSATVDEATARARVASMFGVWQAVATSSIDYSRATPNGFINPVGTEFTDGDVSTLAEYEAVDADCVVEQQYRRVANRHQ